MYTLAYKEQIEAHPDAKVVFYPYEVTNWEIGFKPLPFLKKRMEKKSLITNLTKMETSFFQMKKDNLLPFDEQNHHLILPIHYTYQELTQTGMEYLKNNYIHKRKVWSYPEIHLKNTFTLYIPYLVYSRKVKGREKTFLLEPSTGSEDVLEKYKEIANYLKEVNV
ncbi:hypothetical protein SAMN05421676_102180 [Salinibacillus kushneri]|uniref:Uncharacterized protein n=1 Tax=Salinibacillus kushneri TaxID=237682 RepID=A0A1I0AJQ9_9BACI|nr:hypothetical protein [Salinibacillus kushneri]SES94575.1 hypothetical protein SAMN05421676_102180 [Salinibacillus kushneri]